MEEVSCRNLQVNDNFSIECELLEVNLKGNIA